MRVLILFLLSSPVFADELYQSPAAFNNSKCEQYLMGEAGQQKAELALDWLRELSPMTLMIQQWNSTNEFPDHVTARGVFFDETPVGTTTEEMLHRFEIAKREADRLSQAATASMTASRDLAERPMLEVDQLLALGFRRDDSLTAVGMAAQVTKEPNALVVHVSSAPVDENQNSTFRLFYSSLTHGYDNIASSWQATKLDSPETPPVRTFDQDGEERILREFMAAHGRFLLMRQIAGQKYAYAFDRSMLKRASDKTSNFDLTIYRVIECDRERALRESPILTTRRSSGKYQCFQPLNLRMSVPTPGFSTVFSTLSTSRQAM